MIEEGFVRKIEPSGNYALTLRVVSLGLRHLAFSPSLGSRFPFWRDSLTSQSNWSEIGRASCRERVCT